MRIFDFKINKIIENKFANIKDEEERNDKIIKVYEFAINKMANNIKKDLERNRNKLCKKNKKFEKRNFQNIKSTWEKVFCILDNIIEITQEAMESYSKEFNIKAAEEKNLTYHAIRTIHARAVLCYKECLLLLKHGYSEGATKVWRTMYDLTIIASFIRAHENDKELAQRYIDHIIVDNYREEKAYREQDSTKPRYTSSAFEKMENDYNTIINKYGKNFKNDYGWASNVLNNPNPHLSDLEEDIKNKRFRPHYKTSCNFIHGNYKGNVDKIGLINNDVLLYGPSDYGLSIPCQNIAIILNKINLEFFSIYFSLDYYAAIYAINQYLDELLPLANKIQRDIENNQ